MELVLEEQLISSVQQISVIVPKMLGFKLRFEIYIYIHTVICMVTCLKHELLIQGN